MKRPAIMVGLVRSSTPTSAWVRKAANRAKAVRAAEPIAKPLPMAAVVLPAASSLSVLYLTLGWSPAISAIPPALSEIGPYPSMARERGKFDNIPKAARATP